MKDRAHFRPVLRRVTREETAEVLEVSVRTVERDWVKARGWLYQHMYGSSR